MRTLRNLLLLALLVVTGLGLWQWRELETFADAPLVVPDGAPTLVVAPATPFAHVVRELQRRGITDRHRHYWRALAWRMGVTEALQAGEYALTADLTPRRLLLHMARGDVVQRRFTIVEGWTFRELRAALARREDLVHATEGLDEAEIMRRLGRPGVAAEGRFLPETYAYTRGTSDLDLLQRANAALEAALAAAWESRAPALPLADAEQLLVLASVIEKETGLAEERPRIAGVFARRLKLGMKLQTDPTVIYGLGASFDGNLTRRHLESDTPYNTYTRFGLPPTPIALAGVAALQAAADPAPGDALYFVSRGDGSHEFSASLREHNAAVARYQLRRR